MLRTAKSLKDKGFNLSLIVLKGGGDLLPQYESVFDKVLVLDLRFRNLLSGLLRSIFFVYDRSPVILHSFLFHSNILSRIIKLFRPSVKVINSHRTIEQKYRSHLLFDKWTKFLVDHELSNCEAVRDFILEKTGGNTEKHEVVYNSIETVNADTSTESVKADFGVVASFSEAKGHGLFMDAMDQVSEKYRDLRVSFFGAGRLESIIKERSLSFSDRCEFSFEGNVEDRNFIYSKFSCLVIPSLWEGLPNVLLEAAVRGVPVVTTPVGGVAEVARISKGVIVSEKVSSVSLKYAVQDYLENKNHYQRLAQESSAQIRDFFSRENMVNKYIEIYTKILQKR